jgi:small subunit ribosomal protein S8
MTMTDPIADLATRIRNANRVGKRDLTVPHSKLKAGVCEVLKREGFIDNFTVEGGHIQGLLKVQLRYGPEGEKIIRRIQRVSKPGRRVYYTLKEVKPVLKGMGIAVISTTQGVLSDREARDHRVGGEPLLEVW